MCEGASDEEVALRPVTVNMARPGDLVVGSGRTVGIIVEREPHYITVDIDGAQVRLHLRKREHYAAALPTGHRLMRGSQT